MSTIIYPSPVFGPVHSRRLGISLGINLLPADGKVCSFDCVYCECGFNKQRQPRQVMPTIEHLHEILEQNLQKMSQDGALPDVLTFAGNGEPTLHPHFAEAVDCVISLRNQYCPQAKVSVLSNATRLHIPEVFGALLRVDNNIQKLDTVNLEYILRADRPMGRYAVAEVIEHLCRFNGHVIIQTLFMQGQSEGLDYDNTAPRFVEPYLQALEHIHPAQVMIYTIDRETPMQGLRKATPVQLETIADRVRALGIDVSVSY